MSYPQNPTGAPQPAQPYPPQPGQPYPPQGQPYPPQQPGQPYPPQGQFGAPQQQFGPPVPPAPAKKRAPIRLIISLVVIVIVAVIGIVGYLGSRDDASNAKVNDCLVGQDEKSLKKVDCSKHHDWTVVGKIDNKSESDFDENVCSAYSTATAAYWWGKSGEKGSVLCLAPAS